MKVDYSTVDGTEEEYCPSVQCGFCDQWVCGCRVNERCSEHFNRPCVFGEPE